MSDLCPSFIQDLNYLAFREVCDAYTSDCMPERLIKRLYLKGDEACMERLFAVTINREVYAGEYYGMYTWETVFAQFNSLEAFRQSIRTAATGALRREGTNRQLQQAESVEDAGRIRRRIVRLPINRNRRLQPRRECRFRRAADLLREEQATTAQNDLHLGRELDSAQAFLSPAEVPIATPIHTGDTGLLAHAAGTKDGDVMHVHVDDQGGNDQGGE